MSIATGADRLRLAYLSPLPPSHSGIADYSWELIPHLAEGASITLYTADPDTVPETTLAVRPLSAFPTERWHYDLALYQMGNSALHTDLYQMLLRYPGVVVLHEPSLAHFVAHTTAGQGDDVAFARETRYAGPGSSENNAAQSTIARLVDVSLGVVVHSEFAAEIVRASNPQRPVAVIDQPVQTGSGYSRRKELKLPDDTVVFAVAGQVTAAKQLPRILKALARLREIRPNTHLIVVGESLPEVDLPREIDRLALGEVVTCLGYVASLNDFVDWITTADVVINLRTPTIGETSAVALRAMAAGRPLIVTDHGWYAELPDEAVVKVQPLDDESLFAAMLQLADSNEERIRLGVTAEQTIDSRHRPRTAAAETLEFLNGLRQQWRSRV